MKQERSNITPNKRLNVKCGLGIQNFKQQVYCLIKIKNLDMKNRDIKYIVLHCTATSQDTTVASILNYWKKNLGWKNPGYHFLIEKDGTIHNLHPIESPSNGVAGYNKNSIHISYIGGVGGLDNRTPKQILSQLKLIIEMKEKYPKAEVLGHRDFPKVKKECPSFDVKKWLVAVGF